MDIKTTLKTFPSCGFKALEFFGLFPNVFFKIATPFLTRAVTVGLFSKPLSGFSYGDYLLCLKQIVFKETNAKLRAK